MNNLATHQMKYFHIGFNFHEMHKDRIFENTISSLCQDWVRYTPTNWVVWTNVAPQILALSLKMNMSENDNVLILEITPGQPVSGFFSQWLWNWIYKDRTGQNYQHQYQHVAIPDHLNKKS